MENKGKGTEVQMSDFEMLSLVIMMLGIVVSILLEYIKSTKK